MFFSRILLRKLRVASSASRLTALATDTSVLVGPRWINQTLMRDLTTQIELQPKGLENSFAYNVVKAAGIPVIDKTHEFPILTQVSESNGSEPVLNELSAQLAVMQDTELVTLLGHLQPFRETEWFMEMWKIIDLEGSKRVPQGVPAVLLAGAMKIYELDLNWRSDWIWSCLKRFCRRLDRLTKAEMLQVMFLVNLSRKIPTQYSGFDVQYHLVGHFDDLSLSEMAIVALAFFKSQTRMSNKVIMSKLMRQMIEEAATSSGMTLAMLSKIIRYSLPLTLADELLVVQSRLIEEIPRIELKSLTHLALSGSNALVYHKQFIETIIDQMKRNISVIRLKDMERILHVMSLFYHKDDEFHEMIFKELEGRNEEIQAYPKSLINLVGFSAILEQFPTDLIHRVFSNKFLNETYDASLKRSGTELIFLDKAVEIEKPDYKGNRLPLKILRQSAKIMKFTVKNEMTGTQRFSFELEQVLKQSYGEPNVKYMAVLPQYHFADFIVGFDENLKPLPVPPDWLVHQWGEVKHLPDDKHLWLIIIHGGWGTIIRNTNQHLGLMRSKLRQLKILGYHPIVIPYNLWRESADKNKLVKGIIDNDLMKIYQKDKITK